MRCLARGSCRAEPVEQRLERAQGRRTHPSGGRRRCNSRNSRKGRRGTKSAVYARSRASDYHLAEHGSLQDPNRDAIVFRS